MEKLHLGHGYIDVMSYHIIIAYGERLMGQKQGGQRNRARIYFYSWSITAHAIASVITAPWSSESTSKGVDWLFVSFIDKKKIRQSAVQAGHSFV